jgi:FkbM family methyltransferase
MVPMIVVCYNNYKYVENTIRQIGDVNKEYVQSIIVMDNCSTDEETIRFLDSCTVRVVRNASNNGPWVSPTNNQHIYNEMPDKFILTDPDLGFNPNLPTNFIEILSTLADTYGTSKIGFALDISEQYKLIDGAYTEGRSIVEHETQFWTRKIENDLYTLYRAPIDTTLCLVHKNVYDVPNAHIRVAGDFTAKHLPWYSENLLLNVYENHCLNSNTTRTSTTSSLVLQHIDKKYIMAKKNGKHYFIENRSSDQNMKFWIHEHRLWEPELHNVMDRFLQKDKVFIDIGGWIGTSCIYGSLSSKHVYVVEADPLSFNDMVRNCSLNSRNITCIDRAILDKSDTDVFFGKNRFGGSSLNESTSQVYSSNDSTDDCVTVKTINMQDLISRYNIDLTNVSLIKVDIEGGEECILNDLYRIHEQYRIPMYISFHVKWWRDTNIDRFPFLTSEQKSHLQNDPFASILFE